MFKFRLFLILSLSAVSCLGMQQAARGLRSAGRVLSRAPKSVLKRPLTTRPRPIVARPGGSVYPQAPKGSIAGMPVAGSRFNALRPQVSRPFSILPSGMEEAHAALAEARGDDIEFQELKSEAAKGDKTDLLNLAVSGEVDAIKDLVSKGLDINTEGGRNPGLSPLVYAVEIDNPTAIETLVAAGADPTQRGPAGLTPLQYAAARGKVKATRALSRLVSDADMEAALGDAVFLSQFEAFKALAEENPRLREKALQYAVMFGNSSLVKDILDLGLVDVNAEDEYGNTPLIYAIVGDKLESIKVLLESGANPNIKSNNGNTPLSYAITQADFFERPGALEAIRLLREAGAEVDSESRSLARVRDETKEALGIVDETEAMASQAPTALMRVPKGPGSELVPVEGQSRDEGYRDDHSSGWGDVALGAAIVGASAGLSRDSDEGPEIVQEPYV